MDSFFYESLLTPKLQDTPSPSADDLKIINSLNRHGPLKKLEPEEVQIRSINILGEEPTSKMSIHPQGTFNGRNLPTLQQVVDKLPGAPMMVGHRVDKTPWGRTFKAQLLTGQPGYKGHVVRQYYWFLNDEEGKAIARKIDGGIWAEGSISYWFKEARCSICHKPMASYSFMGMAGRTPRCKHKIGEKDPETGQICYWYPYIIKLVGETSYVYRGAYPHTRSFLAMDDELVAAYSPDEMAAARELENQLTDAGLDFTSLDDSSNIPASSPATVHINLEEPNEPQTPPPPPTTPPPTEPPATPTTEPHGTGDEPPAPPRPSGDDLIPPEPPPPSDSPIEPHTQEPPPPTSEDLNDKQGDGQAPVTPSAPAEPPPEPAAPDPPPPPGVPQTDLSTDGYPGPLEFLVSLSQVEGLESAAVDEIRAALGDDPDLDHDERLSLIEHTLADYDEHLAAARSCLAHYLDEVSRLNDTISALPDESFAYCGTCDAQAAPDEAGRECAYCGGVYALHADTLLRLGTPVGPLKPQKSGVVGNEFYDLEAFRDLPAGDYYVEPKYDGVWMELHKRGGDVSLFSDEGNEYANKFPGIVAEAKRLKATNFAIAGEMTRWRGRKRLTHEDVSAWIHTKGDVTDDHEFRFKPFDLMIYLGSDIRKLPLGERRTKMDAIIKFGKQIHPTAYRLVKHAAGDGKLVNAINDRKTREGAMVKAAEGRYSKSDQKLLWKWKRRYEIDAKVTSIKEKEGGGWVYSCAVGRGRNQTDIGDTYATKIKANVGDIITVTVDHVRYDPDSKKFSWFAPKVLRLRSDKSHPDTLPVIRKMAQVKRKAANLLTLTEVVPKLKRAAVSAEMFLTGGIVENGCTTHDIDLVVRQELTDADMDSLRDVLGEELFSYLEVTYDPDGPAGPNLPIITDMAVNDGKWKYSNKFVLQEHGWGKKTHYDLRFGAPRTQRMWGWTCFSMPPEAAGSKKTRCQEKKYHDPKWMDVDTKQIAPGEPGNPTKNLNAWMVKIDQGTYDFIRRKPKFLEMVLNGKKLKGRYVWREIEVKSKSAQDMAIHKVDGDEVGVKTDKIWIMWKPLDQTLKAPVKKIAFRYHENCLMFWETDEVDHELGSQPDLSLTA